MIPNGTKEEQAEMATIPQILKPNHNQDPEYPIKIRTTIQTHTNLVILDLMVQEIPIMTMNTKLDHTRKEDGTMMKKMNIFQCHPVRVLC